MCDRIGEKHKKEVTNGHFAQIVLNNRIRRNNTKQRNISPRNSNKSTSLAKGNRTLINNVDLHSGKFSLHHLAAASNIVIDSSCRALLLQGLLFSQTVTNKK